MSDTIDNRRTKLADVATQVFSISKSSDIAMGYFFLPRLTPFAQILPKLNEIRLLIGQFTSGEIIDEFVCSQRLHEIQCPITRYT